MCLYLHTLLTTQESFDLENLASSNTQCYSNMLNYLILTEFVLKDAILIIAWILLTSGLVLVTVN